MSDCPGCARSAWRLSLSILDAYTLRPSFRKGSGVVLCRPREALADIILRLSVYRHVRICLHGEGVESSLIAVWFSLTFFVRLCVGV